MNDNSAMGVPQAIRRFFFRIPEERRAWLTAICEFQINGGFPNFTSGADADAWLDDFLNVKSPQHRFGRLICLIAILDFELSPLSLSRMQASAEIMAHAESQIAAKHGRHMLENAVPALRMLVDLWRDLRTHELDEASLWVYRDTAQFQEREGIARKLGFPR